ncbi:MAG: carboxypeptidase regulatory-like domain-containing protein [Lachnospiraceae bacterium]|nr:carboxypeptidase regulatory-like domain-containing protein [Lachnospiraceae bacterium]
MQNQKLRAAQVNHVDQGTLKVEVTSTIGMVPVENARITISYTGDPQNTLEQLNTNTEGQTETVELAAPPLEYSMEPEQSQPYAEYTVEVEAEGYRPVNIEGVDVFSGELSLQNVRMEPLEVSEDLKNIVIPANTLFGNFPPKIAEAEIKPVDESGEIVLSRVVVPEYVVVHDGTPGDSTAGDYYVRYKDYIKNVASSEIYATWPDSTIRANILAIMSFTLNRVYTEW